MIFNRSADMVDKIIDILSHDEELKNLLFYAQQQGAVLPSDTQISDNYILDYPIILQTQDCFSFINVLLDNIVCEEGIYVMTFKISCGVHLPAWKTPEGKKRIFLILDRIEELLNGKKIGDSIGTLDIGAAEAVYWNINVIGYSMMLQMVEQADINESTIEQQF